MSNAGSSEQSLILNSQFSILNSIRIAGRVRESIVDGPGIRYVIFTQGCPHACPGCHNPNTWPMEGGVDMRVSTLLSEIQRDALLQGITLTGGEPFLQAGALAVLAESVRAGGLDVWIYTGYTWEELLDAPNPEWLMLLAQTDILVDGRFEQSLKSYGLRFRGSANQRLIDVKKSMVAGLAVLWE